MYLLAAVGGLRVGEMIFQFILLFIIIGFIIGVVTLIVKNRNNKRLDRIEEKIDKLLSDREK